MSSSRTDTRLRRSLELILKLYPADFRARFGTDIRSDFESLSTQDPDAARLLVRDLAGNVVGTHLDSWRYPHRLPQTQPRPEASMFDNLSRDLAFAGRRLRRRPTLTLLAAFTLALGIGGTTAIFSVINGVMLHPLSAPEPDRLVQLFESSASSPAFPMSYETFRDYEKTAESFEAIGASRSQSVAVNDPHGSPERIRGLFVSSSFFDVLAEGPVYGRAIAAGEDVPGGPRTAVIAHGFWQRRYGGEDDVIGRQVRLNNEPHTIVGIMGPEFRFPYDTTEAWISLQTYPGSLDRENRTLAVIGRLADGVSLDSARQELQSIAAGLEEAHPALHHGVSAGADPLSDSLLGGRLSQMLAILAAAVAMVLLIAAANVANLQLAQATGRTREMALRSALGAGRGRLTGQLLLESLLLAIAGGLLGLGVAHGGVYMLGRLGPGWMTSLYEIEPDAGVLAFSVGVSLVTGIVFGLWPARQAARVDLVDGLRESGRGAGSSRQNGRFRDALVVAQVALAVVLVSGAGLLFRSLQNLTDVDVGFDTANLMTVQFRLPNNKYDDDEKIIQFFDSMLERVAALPGIEGVASAVDMPFTGDGGTQSILVAGIDPGPEVEVPRLRTNVVSQDYFSVMGVPLLSGRGFEATDHASSPMVAVISEQAAETLWPGESPLGKTFGTRDDEGLFTVVGVAGDIYNRGLRNGVDPMIYVNHHQIPERFATVAARTLGDPHSMSPEIRNAIWQLDPEQPIWEVMTQEERIAGWTGSDRFVGTLVGVFALLALALAAVGIGGVVAYSVALRRRELGVRLSLGADRRQILGLVLGQGFRLVMIGVGIGLLAAIGLKDILAGLLFGVEGLDLGVFTAVPLTLICVALVATLGPAWRAACLDPVRTLRED